MTALFLSVFLHNYGVNTASPVPSVAGSVSSSASVSASVSGAFVSTVDDAEVLNAL